MTLINKRLLIYLAKKKKKELPYDPAIILLGMLLLLLLQVTSVVSDSVRPHRRQPTRLPRPWDSPGKNTGVGCHFLLQCMKVKSETEVTQSCLTLSDPTDCSLPGSSIHGVFQARVLERGAIAFSDSWVYIPLKKKMLIWKGTYTLYAHSSIIYNCQDMKAT